MAIMGDKGVLLVMANKRHMVYLSLAKTAVPVLGSAFELALKGIYKQHLCIFFG